MSDATLAQGKQLAELILREENSREFVQNLIERWGVVQLIGRGEVDQATLIEALRHINPYTNEKVEPRFFYPEGYKPNPVEEQVRILLGRFDWLDTSHVSEFVASWSEYGQADGIYVIPKPTVLAAKLGIEDPWTNFGLLAEKGPVAALSETRKFYNYRSGRMGPEYYRLHGEAKSELAALEATQPGDVLVFPAQTGRLYAGFSVRNAQEEIKRVEKPYQWPLPSYIVGWILFANPHRLTRYEDLAIDCPGDEYSFEVGGQFEVSWYFSFSGGKLGFLSRLFGDANGKFGSASGFVRQ